VAGNSRSEIPRAIARLGEAKRAEQAARDSRSETPRAIARLGEAKRAEQAAGDSRSETPRAALGEVKRITHHNELPSNS